MEVSSSEVSCIIRIVREVCDLWDQPTAWREHLLNRACELLNGNVGTMFDAGGTNEQGVAVLRPLAIVGMPTAVTKALVQQSADEFSPNDLKDLDKSLPGQFKLWSDFARQGWATGSTRDLTDMDTYHASAAYQHFRRQADCDEFVWSLRSVDLPKRTEAIDIDRPHGAPAFSQCDVMLLKLLHDEIAPLIGVRLATEEHFSREGLSTRLRQTLALLLKGKSEKQAAADLGLQPRTVHDYVGTLYKHFNVSSRAELMAYFVDRTPRLKATS